MRSFTLLLLFSLLSTNVRATQKCGTSNYFIPIDEKKSHLEASQTCVEYGGAWANVDFENYDEIRQVMDTCFPKGIQVWIRSFGSPENTSQCMRVPSGPGPIKEPITFNCDDKTYPLCTQT